MLSFLQQETFEITYTRSISETFYSMENRAPNGTHGKGTTTIINNSPGTVNKKSFELSCITFTCKIMRDARKDSEK